jgi:3-hydroxyisobutyrate dehydrogenase-like beta-hydroxyacid dehydrogenase
MKLVATILVAVFVVAASMSFAFAECAGHTKAQMVQSNDPKSSSDRVANNEALTPTPDKVVQSAKSEKALEKK